MYLSNKMPELIDLLNVTRIENIIQYHDNLSYCKDKEMYNSQEFTKEYNFYKEKFLKYSKKLLKGKSTRKKLEIYLLYYNRKLYYSYAIIRKNISKKIKRG